MGRPPTKHHIPPRMRIRVRGALKYYYYDMGGKPRKEISLGSDYLEAIKKWTELEQEKPDRKFRPTFASAADRYMVDVLPKKAPRTQTDNLKELARLREFFCNPPAPLDEIRPIHIRQYMDWRTKDGQGMTRANREKALFSHIFNCARAWGMTDSPNPCLGIKGFTEKRREYYVEDDLLERFYEASTLPVQQAMSLAYLTGQRPADTLSMGLNDIQDGAIHITQNKTGKKLAIELTGELKILIDTIIREKEDKPFHSQYLITNERGEQVTQRALQERFRLTKKALQLGQKEFQFRDLRAKAGTDKAILAGLDQAKLQLGHKNIRTTEVYVRDRKADRVKPTR